METWQIILIIIFLILIIVGIILTIYFVRKNEEKKTETVKQFPGITGATGTNAPGNFAIRPNNNKNFRLGVENPNGGAPNVSASADNTQKCENYSWQNIDFLEQDKNVVKSALVFNGTLSTFGNTGASFLYPIQNSSGPSNMTLIQTGAVKFGDYYVGSWNYFPDKQAWCLLIPSSSPLCLYFDGKNVVTKPYDSTDPGFLWVNDNSITPPSCIS